jgi:hypothetical protein
MDFRPVDQIALLCVPLERTIIYLSHDFTENQYVLKRVSVRQTVPDSISEKLSEDVIPSNGLM